MDAMSKIGWTPTEIVRGTARGADRLGERYARENHIPLCRLPTTPGQSESPI
jgi:hypothetical protein